MARHVHIHTYKRSGRDSYDSHADLSRLYDKERDLQHELQVAERTGKGDVNGLRRKLRALRDEITRQKQQKRR